MDPNSSPGWPAYYLSVPMLFLYFTLYVMVRSTSDPAKLAELVDSDFHKQMCKVFLLNVPGALWFIVRGCRSKLSTPDIESGIEDEEEEEDFVSMEVDIESGLEEEEEDFVSMDIDVAVDIIQQLGDRHTRRTREMARRDIESGLEEEEEEEEDFVSMEVDVVVDIIQPQQLSDQETRRIQEMARRCTECAICMEEFESDQDDGVVLKHCGHRFHELCIGVWSETGGKCPLCQASIGGIICHDLLLQKRPN